MGAILKICLGLFLFAFSVGSFLPATVCAQTTKCKPIESLPIVISKKGVYCFKQNLSSKKDAGYIIDIQSDNVTIDFNGFMLKGKAGEDSTAVGVYSFDNDNITLLNGNITGFDIGFYLHTGTGQIVKNNRISQSKSIGIYMYSQKGSEVSENSIIDTGGGTNGSYAVAGIRVYGGYRSVVKNNHISGLFQNNLSSVATGIEVIGARGFSFIGNVIEGSENSGLTETNGISFDGSSWAIRYHTMDNNRMSYVDYGFYHKTSNITNLYYKDNVVHAFTKAYKSYLNNTISSFDAGGNTPPLSVATD